MDTITEYFICFPAHILISSAVLRMTVRNVARDPNEQMDIFSN